MQERSPKVANIINRVNEAGDQASVAGGWYDIDVAVRTSRQQVAQKVAESAMGRLINLRNAADLQLLNTTTGGEATPAIEQLASII